MPNRILVIDVMNVARACFHTVPATIQTRDGRQANALKGFIVWVGAALSQLQPDELVLAFEGKQNWRKVVYPKYKSNRGPSPEGFGPQVQMIREFVDVAGWSCVEPEDGEADDVLASVVASRPDSEVFLYTRDKDAKGLVSDRVSMVDRKNDGSGEVKIITPAMLLEEHGFECRLFPDYLALIGDKGDCIPGVKDVGPATATALLTTFGGSDEAYARLDCVKPRHRTLLEAGRESYLLSKKLIALDTKIPIPASLPTPGVERMSQLVAKVQELGLSINVSKLLARPSAQGRAVEPRPAAQQEQMGLFNM